MATNVQMQEPSSMEEGSLLRKKARFSVVDAFVVLLMGGLLYNAVSWQVFRTNTDVARYQCYAVSFWQGISALNTLPASQCAFITHPSPDLAVVSQDSLLSEMQQLGLPASLVQLVSAQSPIHPFHALPNEYPALSIIPFSLGLIVPAHWYQVAFAV